MSALDRDAVLWFEHACQLEGELRLLRRMLTDVLVVVATRDELLELARTEIEKRWPTDDERRAAA